MKEELIEFLKSARNLCEAWNQLNADDTVKTLNDITTYPFHKSFDELVEDIEVWVEDAVKIK